MITITDAKSAAYIADDDYDSRYLDCTCSCICTESIRDAFDWDVGAIALFSVAPGGHRAFVDRHLPECALVGGSRRHGEYCPDGR